MTYVPKIQTEPLQRDTREYANEAGTVSTWYYDRSISTKGPYRVEQKYTKEYLDSLKEKKKRKLKTK